MSLKKNIRVGKMRVNLLANPVAIARDDVRFSWTICSDGRNVKQTAYRIWVATSIARMQAGQ